MVRYALLVWCATALVACGKVGEALAPAGGSSTAAKAPERISEDSPEAAILKHGFPALLKAAEDGDRKAQHFVAVTYLAGSSVPKSYADSERWALRAANQGSSASQFLVGMFRKDDALSGNLYALQPKSTLAYMWFSLAASQGHEGAKRERDMLERAMEPAWITRAQSLAAAWRTCASASCLDAEPTP